MIKVEIYLFEVEYFIGNGVEDCFIYKFVIVLVGSECFCSVCLIFFDEVKLWCGLDVIELK